MRSTQRVWSVLAVTLLLAVAAGVSAQPPVGGRVPPSSPREASVIDLTGQWVAIVNEDWRWRMVTPPKGDYTSVQPLNERGRAVADSWQPGDDGSCRAYGAPGVMRMPTRLRIDWEGDAVLTIRTDAGEQLRRLDFTPASGAGVPSLQGRSAAVWRRTLPPPGARGAQPDGGSLEVTTTELLPGWLRKNGVPYSGDTVLTEYFDRFAAPNGDEWLVVTAIVADPQYLNGRFITSSHFKREQDRSKWKPQPCKPL